MTIAVTTPRQLAPTVGVPTKGVEILEGACRGMEKVIVGILEKDEEKIIVDDTCWGPEADELEGGFQVNFG